MNILPLVPAICDGTHKTTAGRLIPARRNEFFPGLEGRARWFAQALWVYVKSQPIFVRMFAFHSARDRMAHSR